MNFNLRRFENLNNSLPDHGGVSVMVWYCDSSNEARDIRWGESPSSLEHHIYLGVISDCVGGTDSEILNCVYFTLQGEVWSPNGEAREHIMSLGLGHTSLSIGDIVMVGSCVYYLGFDGWVLCNFTN